MTNRVVKNVQASNRDAKVNSMFAANVSAMYQGLTSSGQFDAEVVNQDQYRTFQQEMRSYVTSFGGDANLANRIQSSPQTAGSFATFQDWVQTAKENPAILAMQTMRLLTLMSQSDNEELMKRSEDVRQA